MAPAFQGLPQPLCYIILFGLPEEFLHKFVMAVFKCCGNFGRNNGTCMDARRIFSSCGQIRGLVRKVLQWGPAMVPE